MSTSPKTATPRKTAFLEPHLPVGTPIDDQRIASVLLDEEHPFRLSIGQCKFLFSQLVGFHLRARCASPAGTDASSAVLVDADLDPELTELLARAQRIQEARADSDVGKSVEGASNVGSPAASPPPVVDHSMENRVTLLETLVTALWSRAFDANLPLCSPFRESK